jgi:TP901 family phage tail tape measure protein
MSGAGGVRAGSAYVEIFAKDGKFQQALDRVQAKLQQTGASMRKWGTQAAMGGALFGAPMVMAMGYFAAFDDVLKATQASTGATAAEMQKLRDAALTMSESLGIDPTQVASGFMELLKAGMSLEQVLGGAGEAAIQFAEVSGMAVSEAAVVMADAMAVFGVSGEKAANTLSAAADSSSTDISGMAQSFAQVSAVAGLANQSIEDTAATLAILANNGIKGSDAGTSLKTMLMRLMAPADDAIGALGQLGLSVASFRNADGSMRPMVEIIGTLTNSMAGLNQSAKDDIFRRIFGSDSIRAAAVLTKEGVAGFESMRTTMDQAMPVGEKFMAMMDSISGSMKALWASVKRVAVVFGEALAPSFKAFAEAGKWVAGVVKEMLARFPILSKILAGGAFTMVALGTAAIAGGIGLQVLSSAINVVTSVVRILPMLFSPVGLVILAIAGAIALVVMAIRALSPAFKKATDYMMGATDKAKGNMEALKKKTEDAQASAQMDAATQKVDEQLAAAQAARDSIESSSAGGPAAEAMGGGEPAGPQLRGMSIDEARQAGPDGTVSDDYRASSSITAGLTAPQATIGTFGSAVGLGISSELMTLQEPTEETAMNTARMADTLDGMATSSDTGSVIGGPANRAGAVAQQAQAGVAASAGTLDMAGTMKAGFEAVVAAVGKHAELTRETNTVLKDLTQKITVSLPGALSHEIARRMGMTFQ